MSTQTNRTTIDIIELLLREGVFAWRENSTGVFDAQRGIYRPSPKTGMPDICAIMPPDGRFLGIEVKTGRDRLRESQVVFHEHVRMCGGLVLVVKDLEDFKKQWLDDHEYTIINITKNRL